jgi:hypothetical protein
VRGRLPCNGAQRAPRLPEEDVLIFAGGEYFIGVLVKGEPGSAPAFMDVRSSDILPWPTRWMELPAAPEN